MRMRSSFNMAADSLVVHRVKECCVRLYSCVQKWQQLSSQGVDVASRLVQTVMQNKYIESEYNFGALKGDPTLPPALEGKLMVERERLYSQLVDVKEKLLAVVREMGRLSHSVSSAVDLLLCQGQEPSTPLFDTLPASVYSEYFSDLFQAYSGDMSARESVVGDIMRQNDRDILTVYLMCWLHQPYITTECSDKLEALLLDSGLRT